MAPLTLRWEWRAFGTSFGAAEDRLRDSLAPPRSSAETYLLAPVATVNVKIRNDLLDLKQLEQVDVHGLELWHPVLTSPFPLDVPTLTRLMQSWSVPATAVRGPCGSLHDLLALARDVGPALIEVPLTKLRASGTWRECRVEVTSLSIGTIATRTLAVEMSDPLHLWRVVEDLGLADMPNENYVRALQRLARTQRR